VLIDRTHPHFLRRNAQRQEQRFCADVGILQAAQKCVLIKQNDNAGMHFLSGAEALEQPPVGEHAAGKHDRLRRARRGRDAAGHAAVAAGPGLPRRLRGDRRGRRQLGRHGGSRGTSRPRGAPPAAADRGQPAAGGMGRQGVGAVSYTPLTLPTNSPV